MSESLGFLLVVDDEEMNRDMLSRRLELEGYSVMTAPAAQRRSSLFLSMISMPCFSTP